MNQGGAGSSPRLAAAVRANPIRTRKDWEAAPRSGPRAIRARSTAEIARRASCSWLDGESGAWVKRVDGATPWLGFDAATGARRADLARGADASGAVDAGLTERHGGARSTAGSRAASRTRASTRWTSTCSRAAGGRSPSTSRATAGIRRPTAAEAGPSIRASHQAASGAHVAGREARRSCSPTSGSARRRSASPSTCQNVMEQIYFTEAAKRLGIIYTPVFGGFSAKTLSDRIHDAGAKVVITTDGARTGTRRRSSASKEPVRPTARSTTTCRWARRSAVVLRARCARARAPRRRRRRGHRGGASRARARRRDHRRCAPTSCAAWAARSRRSRAAPRRRRRACARRSRRRLAKPVARVERVVNVDAQHGPGGPGVGRRARSVWAHELGEGGNAQAARERARRGRRPWRARRTCWRSTPRQFAKAVLGDDPAAAGRRRVSSSSSSTRAAARGSPRASCTRTAATSRGSRTRCGTRSTSRPSILRRAPLPPADRPTITSSMSSPIPAGSRASRT